MKDNYEKLEGNNIAYIITDGYIIKGKVALIEKGIGITLVYADNENKNLACLIMKNSPKWRKEWNDLEKATEEAFNIYIEGIKKGKIYIDDLINHWRTYSRYGGGQKEVSKEDCAFT